ncbi:MAG: histidine phosphatase family protein [Candidatus Heimdallarchaeota archaeon]|nr:histidine phosphatase family protein [Candidatus Heimdallarchaeota archaeon]MCK4877157.1 histidine phosphatase family protein [Candidatus Heimdallarchaeota archaeon]
MKIYLARHGETEYNRKRLIMGQLDIPLNEKGVKQAEKLAKSLKDKRITAIYSSDLSRAYKTAEIISEELKLPVTGVTEFKEHTLGKLDGTDWTEEYEVMTLDEFEKVMMKEGAEELEIFYDRVWNKFLQVVENHPIDENLLIVMHGGCTRVIIMKILKASDDLFASLSQNNACFNIITYKEKRPRFKFIIEKINECCHLEEI